MTKRQVIGIMGGSFNPVHAGHLMVANYIRQRAGLDEVWLSLSPANPLKHTIQQVSDAQRLEMLNLATANAAGLTVIDIETRLPRPSYTITLLDTLKMMHPDKDFRLIIGSDNWLVFNKWRDHEKILKNYGVIIYPRPGYEIKSLPGVADKAVIVDAPHIEISSTFIRDGIAQGLDMNFFLPSAVNKYIERHKLYREHD